MENGIIVGAMTTTKPKFEEKFDKNNFNLTSIFRYRKEYDLTIILYFVFLSSVDLESIICSDNLVRII